MGNSELNLPTDIPWERICVTEDMIDPKVCDDRLPAKWQTSLAVFKYRPEDEYQLYPKYNISYLKVTATITGYQPLDKEIQGNIDWDGVDVSTIPGLTDLLNSYNPCHGAILQVIVGPKSKETKTALKDYPFFLDFEPKKRELYELATDTKEKQSRSIESLNITKSSGSTQSLEVLDVDMGGSVSTQASIPIIGGGFSTSSSSNGQWGTKRLNTDESMSTRSSEVGQEKRESFSYSTQLSQMYHLLDSYHLGTNRVAFFIQPRPHTLEEPSGFVRGPRPVDGIQEFFMVVAQPKDQKDFCVSVRLDTSHLTKIPIMDYERKTDVSEMASATAPIPTKNDTMGRKEKWGEACLIGCWDMYYQCYLTHDVDDKVYTAPSGYIIESYNNLVNSHSYGSSNVTVSPNRKTLTIHAEANGKICYEDTFGCVDCPDEWQKHSGSARRQVQVNLVSQTPIKQVGEEEVLMITTRGLCCCPSEIIKQPMDEFVVDIKRIPKQYQLKSNLASNLLRAYVIPMNDEKTPDKCEESCKESVKQECDPDEGKNNIRRSNELSDYIKTETIKSLNNPTVKLQKFMDMDFFSRQLELRLLQSKKGRQILNNSVVKVVPEKSLISLKKYFKREAKGITCQELLNLKTEDAAKALSMTKDEVHMVKLNSLGIKLKARKPQ